MSNNVIETIPGESDNLALHVQLCEQRYLQLINKFDQVDGRLDKIENVLVEIKTSLQTTNIEVYKKYLAWAGVVITALGGLIIHLLSR